MFKLPELGYSFDALEPHIDGLTMEIHHGKHHQTYVDKLNEAISKHSELADKTIEELLQDIHKVPDDIRAAIQNNGGGHHNHSQFWLTMKPGGTKQPQGALAEALTANFGSFEGFKTKLTDEAIAVFGSGWAWLATGKGDKLEAYSTGRQDSPLMEGKTPILGLDVWEHAYYLKYQNRRPDYIDAWWNVVNWDEVGARLNT